MAKVLGASWYHLSVERVWACWKEVCRLESPSCQDSYFACRSFDQSRDVWFQSSNLTILCNTSNSFYQFGIYADAMDSNIAASHFIQIYFYCFWWGLKNLRYVIKTKYIYLKSTHCYVSWGEMLLSICSSLGQDLSTSIYVGEISFAINIAILGLILFGLLIGNMQVSTPFDIIPVLYELRSCTFLWLAFFSHYTDLLLPQFSSKPLALFMIIALALHVFMIPNIPTSNSHISKPQPSGLKSGGSREQTQSNGCGIDSFPWN